MANCPQKGPSEDNEVSRDLVSACEKLKLKLGSPRKAAMAAIRKPGAQEKLTPAECDAIYGYFKINPGAFEFLVGDFDHQPLEQHGPDVCAKRQEHVRNRLQEIELAAYQRVSQDGSGHRRGGSSDSSPNTPSKLKN